MTAPDSAFRYEITDSEDANKYVTTTITCHGRLITQNKEELRALVHPLIQRGGRRIVLDFADLDYVDSSGLGAVVGLKASAISKGLCTLQLVNLTPRVKQLFSITNVLQMLSE
jgi:anti-sigma B factor antagonist